MLKNTVDSWGSVSKFFHWLIALLVIFMLCLGISLSYIPKDLKSTFYTIHKSTGITILILMILRLFWRWANVVPKLPVSTPNWQKISARTSHALLYIVIILMPLSGWAMSTAANKPVNFWWLGKISLPFVPHSKSVAGFFADTHFALAVTIGVLLVIHIGGAFTHLLIRKDRVLWRMAPKWLHRKSS